MAQARPGAVVPACLLAWLLPGAGHMYLGRTRRGLFFLAALCAMFVLGIAMNAQLTLSLGLDDPLAVVRSIARVMLGIPYLLARGLAATVFATDFSDGRVTSVTFEYGNTFAEVAGLLNVLVILDAHDVAVGRKG